MNPAKYGKRYKDAPVSEEDRVIYLLASLLDSCNMIVIALEMQSESVPKWSLVTKRLLHQEANMKEKDAQGGEVKKKAFSASSQQKRRKLKPTFSSAIFVDRLDIPTVIAESSWPLRETIQTNQRPHSCDYTCSI